MLSDNLAIHRESIEMSPRHVAEWLSVPLRDYLIIETGGFDYAAYVIGRLAECFDCTADELIGRIY